MILVWGPQQHTPTKKINNGRDSKLKWRLKSGRPSKGSVNHWVLQIQPQKRVNYPLYIAQNWPKWVWKYALYTLFFVSGRISESQDTVSRCLFNSKKIRWFGDVVILSGFGTLLASYLFFCLKKSGDLTKCQNQEWVLIECGHEEISWFRNL